MLHNEAVGDKMAMADMRASFGLLGPLLVMDLNGMAISIPQAKQRVIMAALLLNANETVSTTQLMSSLWENEPPPNGMAAIRTYVARLRRTLGQVGARLVSRPAGYAIEVREAAEFDLSTLEQLRLELRGAADSRQWERVALISGRALALWRGAPLEGIPSPSLRRIATEGLEELRIEFITTRIDAELCLGQDRHVVAELRQLASEHPLREHIQAQLALSYYRCGRQFEALKVYQNARASLVGELGIEPGPELRELHQRILTADPVLDSAYPLPNAFTGMPARRRLGG
jgi:DNA-binding SARP family transcriptional activator